MPKEIFEHPETVESAQTEGGGDKVTKIVFDKGIYVYLEGHPFPHRGMPTPQAIWAANVAKTALMTFLKQRWWMMPFTYKYAYEAFLSVSWRALQQHILKYEFLSPTSQAVFSIVYDILEGRENQEKMAKIIAHIIEYDGAYRFRLMDLASETSKTLMLADPVGELWRLLEINKARDYAEVSNKVERVVTLLSYALLIPSLSKRFRAALSEVDFSKLQFDLSDKYWACRKVDYNYGGRKNN